MLCYRETFYTYTNPLRCLPPAFGARGSGHKGLLNLQFRLIKPVVIYIVHKHVAVSLLIYLQEHVLCNKACRQGRILAVPVFNLVHTRIQYRVVTGLSDRKTIIIA